jgi:hypothetical protein
MYYCTYGSSLGSPSSWGDGFRWLCLVPYQNKRFFTRLFCWLIWKGSLAISWQGWRMAAQRISSHVQLYKPATIFPYMYREREKRERMQKFSSFIFSSDSTYLTCSLLVGIERMRGIISAAELWNPWTILTYSEISWWKVLPFFHVLCSGSSRWQVSFSDVQHR